MSSSHLPVSTPISLPTAALLSWGISKRLAVVFFLVTVLWLAVEMVKA